MYLQLKLSVFPGVGVTVKHCDTGKIHVDNDDKVSL